MEILEQNAAYVVCVKPAGIPSQGEGPEAMPARLAAELRALSAQPAAHRQRSRHWGCMAKFIRCTGSIRRSAA